MEYGGGAGEYEGGGGEYGGGGAEYGKGEGEYPKGENGGPEGGLVLMRYDIWDLNNGAIPEFPVKNPPGWDDISLWYAKALQNMGWTGAANPGPDIEQTWTYSTTPNQYYFQAAIHWTPKTTGLPPNWQQWWKHCTHESGAQNVEGFFLPWHRAYIYWYEVLIQSWVKQNGGPENWTLPYWNYSGAYNASNPSAPWPRSVLPWVFGQPTLPDGSGNPLFYQTSRRGLQPGIQLVPTTPYYYQAYGQTDYYLFNSTLDQQPHGRVHGDVGSGDGVASNTGWMQFVDRAAYDPIFWLHHAEIDRFWSGWNANGYSNPTDPGWTDANNDPRKATRWNFWWPDGTLVVVYPGQVTNNKYMQPPCPYSYVYENYPEMPPPRPPGPALVRRAAPEALRAGGGSEPDPTIAASDEAVQLGKEPVTHTLAVSDEAVPVMESLAGAPEEAPRVYLHLDDITAPPESPPGNYDVYLNYPDADHTTLGTVPHYVGGLAGFGADHVHDAEGEAEGHAHGLSAQYDITELVNHLREEGDWDQSKATVTFVPAVAGEPEELVTEGLRVGNVSIKSS